MLDQRSKPIVVNRHTTTIGAGRTKPSEVRPTATRSCLQYFQQHSIQGSTQMHSRMWCSTSSVALLLGVYFVRVFVPTQCNMTGDTENGSGVPLDTAMPSRLRGVESLRHPITQWTNLLNPLRRGLRHPLVAPARPQCRSSLLPPIFHSSPSA